MRLFFAAIAALTISLPAQAQSWWEAETDHFRVVSQGQRDEAVELAVDLERFDEAMRYLQNIPADQGDIPASTKLTVFRFGTDENIASMQGSRGSGVAGFFIPRAGRSVAFVPRRAARTRGSIGVRREEGLPIQVVLFHEYAHYFMFQHRPAAYPMWYSEGFAEVYGTMQLTDEGFIFGAPATHRAAILYMLDDYSVRRLLDPPAREDMDGEDGAQIYAMGWMLSHFLTFTPERQGQLSTYLALLNSGQSSIEAAEQAFGDLDVLNDEVDDYRKSRARAITVSFPDYAMPQATARQLGEDEVAMMDMHIKSSHGVDEDSAQALVGTARRLAERYPTSLPVQLAVAEAQFDAGNYEEAETAANQARALDEGNARALIYLGYIAMERAKEDPAQFAVARSHFAAANRLEPLNPEALYNYYLSYSLSPEPAPENALVALETSFSYARFDNSIRMSLAHLLMSENRDDDAVAVLGPLANDPHANKLSQKVARAIENLRAGDREEARCLLSASIDTHDDDEEENETEDEDDGEEEVIVRCLDEKAAETEAAAEAAIL